MSSSSNYKFLFLVNLTDDELLSGQAIERQLLDEEEQEAIEELLAQQQQQMHYLKVNYQMVRKEMGGQHDVEWSEWSALNDKKRKNDSGHNVQSANKRAKFVDDSSDSLPHLSWSLSDKCNDDDDSDDHDNDSIQILDVSNENERSIIILSDDKTKSRQSIENDSIYLIDEKILSVSERMFCIANSTELDVSSDLF